MNSISTVPGTLLAPVGYRPKVFILAVIFFVPSMLPSGQGWCQTYNLQMMLRFPQHRFTISSLPVSWGKIPAIAKLFR